MQISRTLGCFGKWMATESLFLHLKKCVLHFFFIFVFPFFPFCCFSCVSFASFSFPTFFFFVILLPRLQKLHRHKILHSGSALFSPYSVASVFTLGCWLHLLLDSSAQKWLYAWKGLGKDIDYYFSEFPSATRSCVKLTQPTAERNGLGKSTALCSRVSMQRAGRAELQRNPSVTWRPVYSSSGPEFGTTLWAFLSLKNKTKHKLKPLSPSAWDLLAYFLENISEVVGAQLPFRWKFEGALQDMCRY